MTLRLVIVLCCLAAAGCAAVRTAPTQPATPRAAAAPEPEQAPALALPPPAPDKGDAEATVASVDPAVQAGHVPAPTQPAPPPATSPHSAPVAATHHDHGADTTSDAPQSPVATAPTADTLDFAALGARLRSTKALGVLAKLSVKNQADDLLEQFRDYYLRRGTATLPDLHRSYDSLVYKLLSLLQDGDPPLATDIDRSRTAIWDILSNQRKFTDSNLMAGASTGTDSTNR